MGVCEQEGCEGPAVWNDDRCLGHVEAGKVEQIVQKLAQSPKRIDVGRATIDAGRVGRILSAATLSGGGTIRVPVTFGGARVSGELKLASLRLAARLDFAGATIEKLAVGQIEGIGHLRLGAPGSGRTQIGALAVAECLRPDDEWTVAEVDVAERLTLRRTTLRFLGLDGVRLGERCVISDVSIGTVLHVRACAAGEVVAERARVTDGVTVDPLYAERLQLDSCTFESWVDVATTAATSAERCVFGGPTSIRWEPAGRAIEALAEEGPRGAVSTSGVQPPEESDAALRLRSIRFGSTAHLRPGGADVELPGCVFSDASTLARAEEATSLPRLTSVDEMDGDELRIGTVDVSSCRLAAAASLGPIDPAGLRLGFGSAGVTHRHYLADEEERVSALERAFATDAARQARQVEAQQLAATYRDLRRGNEEVGNHSGANDLYYGERLWERKAARLGRVDWLWLAAYGLVGYGVRPLRPFVWLVALIVASALAFDLADGLYRERAVAGRPTETVAALCERDQRARTPERTQVVMCPARLAETLEFSVRTTTTLIRPVGGFELRGAGVVLDIFLRLGAALLFALLVLAIRNRVRR